MKAVCLCSPSILRVCSKSEHSGEAPIRLCFSKPFIYCPRITTGDLLRPLQVSRSHSVILLLAVPHASQGFLPFRQVWDCLALPYSQIGMTKLEVGVVTHTVIPALRRRSLQGLCRVEASLSLLT